MLFALREFFGIGSKDYATDLRFVELFYEIWKKYLYLHLLLI